jgi:beta-lactam-binding protein with PASTA domain
MIVACAAASLLLAACGGTTATSPSTVTVTQSTSAVGAPPVTKSATPSQITIPDVTGQNAEIAQKKLEDLGLTDVSLASANPKYSMVLLAKNWTVVSVEPAPGTVVKADDPVIVKVTKE